MSYDKRVQSDETLDTRLISVTEQQNAYRNLKIGHTRCLTIFKLASPKLTIYVIWFWQSRQFQKKNHHAKNRFSYKHYKYEKMVKIGVNWPVLRFFSCLICDSRFVLFNLSNNSEVSLIVGQRCFRTKAAVRLRRNFVILIQLP